MRAIWIEIVSLSYSKWPVIYHASSCALSVLLLRSSHIRHRAGVNIRRKIVVVLILLLFIFY